VYAALHAGHTVGDHWTQTGRQAVTKGQDDIEGRVACVTHVATLTATQGVFLALACLTTGERLNARRVACGLVVNAVSHYVADRRTPLRKLADLLQPSMGKRDFYDMGETPLASGAYALDQAWHVGWCAIAAAIITGRN
jgi:hypothetical protein